MAAVGYYDGSGATFPTYNCVGAAEEANQATIAASEEQRKTDLRKTSLAMLRLGSRSYAEINAAHAAVAAESLTGLVDFVEVAPARV